MPKNILAMSWCCLGVFRGAGEGRQGNAPAALLGDDGQGQCSGAEAFPLSAQKLSLPGSGHRTRVAGDPTCEGQEPGQQQSRAVRRGALWHSLSLTRRDCWRQLADALGLAFPERLKIQVSISRKDRFLNKSKRLLISTWSFTVRN